MATRGRPKKEKNIHKVAYYQIKPEMIYKAEQKVLESRLTKAYTKLFKLSHEEMTTEDKRMIDRLVKQGLNLIQ